jgi:hypothetical protein
MAQQLEYMMGDRLNYVSGVGETDPSVAIRALKTLPPREQREIVDRVTRGCEIPEKTRRVLAERATRFALVDQSSRKERRKRTSQ